MIAQIAARGLTSSEVVSSEGGGGGSISTIRSQDNTRSSFDQVLAYNVINPTASIRILAPSVMVTKAGDIILAHDNTPSAFYEQPN